MLTQQNIDLIISTCKEIAPTGELHPPNLTGNERTYLGQCLSSNQISSIGGFVNQFADSLKKYTRAGFVLPMINGTAALRLGLQLVGVSAGDLVITQGMSFVATVNSIFHCGAEPCFIDVDMNSLGMSPRSLRYFFEAECSRSKTGTLTHEDSGRRIAACVPVHTLGMSAKIDEIVNLCSYYGVPVVEDAAEALGSFYMSRHCGTWGQVGILSFNGNKTITTGGGGALLTNDEDIYHRAHHYINQAKVGIGENDNTIDYFHDTVGDNLRMNNLCAAIGCAQMERLEEILDGKLHNYRKYKDALGSMYRSVPDNLPWGEWNHWLVPMICQDWEELQAVKGALGDAGIQSRGMWYPLYKLPPFVGCYSGEQSVVDIVHRQFLCLPSGVA